jgi:hypothetical protein
LKTVLSISEKRRNLRESLKLKDMRSSGNIRTVLLKQIKPV